MGIPDGCEPTIAIDVGNSLLAVETTFNGLSIFALRNAAPLETRR